MKIQHFLTFLEAALTVLASPGDIWAEIRRSRTNSARSATWLSWFGLNCPMCRDGLPASWPDLGGLGRKRGQDLGETWPGGLPYGPPGAGMQLGGSVSVSGCVSGPCWAISGHGGSVRCHFSDFRIFPGGPPLYAYSLGVVCGLLTPDIRPLRAAANSQG